MINVFSYLVTNLTYAIIIVFIDKIFTDLGYSFEFHLVV